MNIKNMIIKLCDDMIAFQQKLKKEIEVIPDENNTEVLCKWDNFFEENIEPINELSDVKSYVNSCRL